MPVSFEPFWWGGELYVSFQILDRNDTGPGCALPHCTKSEIWVAKLRQTATDGIAGSDFACRVSAATTGPFRGKLDPESVVRGERALLYYQRADLRKTPNDLAAKLAVIDLGDRGRFDAACAAGHAMAADE